MAVPAASSAAAQAAATTGRSWSRRERAAVAAGARQDERRRFGTGPRLVRDGLQPGDDRSQLLDLGAQGRVGGELALERGRVLGRQLAQQEVQGPAHP